MIGLLAEKIGMTQIFDEQGRVIPVTILTAGPCPIVQVKTAETDGYGALQIGFGKKRETLIPKGLQGHLKKHKAAGIRTLKEVRVDDTSPDRKSTRLNSSHITISYAVFCLKKQNEQKLD